MSETIAVNKELYGAFELKRLYPRNYAIGVAVAVFFHLLLITSYYLYQVMTREDADNVPMVKIVKYSELGPPPSISEAPPQIAVAAQTVAPTVGVPVPVPSDQAPPEQTIATQQEMAAAAAPTLTSDLGANTQIEKDIKIEAPQQNEEPGMDTFTAFENPPEMVSAAKPEYPEIAKRAGITGKVFVKVLVDKEGRAKKAVVIKTDSDLFNQAAIDAAMKSAFTPALQNHHPIAVWIVLPYKFQLNE